MGHSQKAIDSLTKAGIATVLFNQCEMDAFSHVCKALTSNQSNPHSDILCYDNIKRISK